ncbi:MAG: hypothetical protein AB1668_01170 [Nanoarchaeota archaeon]
MNIHFKNYLDSFRLGKKYLLTLLIDALSFSVIAALWLVFGNILTARAYVISEGRSAEELKLLMLSGSLEANKLLLANIKAFVFTFIIGLILAVVITILVFSLSRMLIWDKVLGGSSSFSSSSSKFAWKNFKKWNGMTLVLLLLSAVYALIYGLLKVIINFLTSSLSETVFLWVNRGVNYLFFTIFILLMFIVFHSFSREHKAWLSVGDAFHQIKVSWPKLWRLFIFVVLTGTAVSAVLSLVTFLLLKLFPSLSPVLMLHPGFLPLLSMAVGLLLISWIRLYLFKAILSSSLAHNLPHEHSKEH